MANLYKRIRAEKAKYRREMERVQHMPEDYQFVFSKCSAYLWSQAGGLGTDTLRTLYRLIDIFDEGAQNGWDVRDILGDNPAAFCEDLSADDRRWINAYRHRANAF